MFKTISLSLVALFVSCSSLVGQGTALWTALNPGSDNITVVGHIPLGPRLSVADMDLEQELDRPFAYVSRMIFGDDGERGTDIISIADPANPVVIYSWRIEDQELHLGTGGMDVKHFKIDDRYYVVQSYQFGQGGPNADLGAVILDVTGLPDATTVKEVGRIYEPDLPGGFHNIFVYKHSSGKVLLMSTVGGPFANVYDLGKAVKTEGKDALIAQIPLPSGEEDLRGYHDFYAGYHVESETDRFYGGGRGGYFVFDITDLEDLKLLVTLTGVRGVDRGHTFTPTPDGRYAVAEVEYQYAPLRIFDLKPGLDGEVSNISEPIGAWTADWQNLTHNHEVRWPYVFVSGYLDGLQIFDMRDPYKPVTVGYYDTYLGPPNTDRYGMFQGAFGIDVRNADGLITVSDMTTGFWVFRMDGFNGWNGEQWGMPNVSSVQNWDHGPAMSD